MEKKMNIIDVKQTLDEALENNKRIRVKFRIAKTELFVEIPLRRTGIIRDGFGERWTDWSIRDGRVNIHSVETDVMGNRSESSLSYLLSNVVSILESEE